MSDLERALIRLDSARFANNTETLVAAMVPILRELARRELPTIQVKRLTATAKLPTRGSDGAAGWDLYADLPEWRLGLSSIGDYVNIRPGERALIKTGIAMVIPDGYYLRIAPRSGLANKHGADILGGVIDLDYRGEVGVILLNTGNTPFIVHHGERIAQGVLTRIADSRLEEIEQLPETARNADGFGSTGR